MYFSIAPQTLTLPDGTCLSFAVDATDSSLVTLTVANDAGSVVSTFKRNGEIIGTPEPVKPQEGAPPVLAPRETTTNPNGAQVDASAPYTKGSDKPPYNSVDAEPVRADDWSSSGKPAGKSKGDSKPAA